MQPVSRTHWLGAKPTRESRRLTAGRAAEGLLLAVAVAMNVGALAGCASSAGDSAYASTLKQEMEVVSSERGHIIAVNDVMIDPRQAGRIIASSSPATASNVSGAAPVPPPSRRGLRIPLSPGTPTVPAEEITVQMREGRIVMVVQERASPAMAKGERVRVVTERAKSGLGLPETRVLREP